MKKEIIYILKRVIIGILIAVILFSLKGCYVKASELPTSYNRTLLNGLQFPPYNKFKYVGINSNGMTERTVADWMSSDLATRYYYISGLYNDANGFSFSFLNDNVFVVGHNYNVALVYCTTTTVINGYRQFSVGTGTSFQKATANAGTNQNLQKDYSNLGSFNTGAEDFSTCFLAQVNFTADVGGNVLAFKFWNSAGSINMGTLAFMGYYIDDMGQDFTTFKNQIINNQNNNRNDIINNQNNTTQSLINQLISGTNTTIDSQKVCKKIIYSKNDSGNVSGFLANTGNLTGNESSDTVVTKYIDIEYSTTIKAITAGRNTDRLCFYNTNKEFISCVNRVEIGEITKPNNAKYMRITIKKSDNNPQIEVESCKNGNQAIQESQQETTDAVNELNDNITSEAPPNLSSLNNSAGWLPAGPVDSILNLPLALLNNINTNLSKICQPVILNIPLVNKELPLPCISTLYDEMGITTWVNTIGAIASAFILFSYFVKLYKWVDDTLTFRENNYMDNWGGV